MLGSVRFLLASMVLLNHLWLPVANKIGAHAVIGFYILSGFLMAKVLRERYGDGFQGTCRFLINRALRIFPPYWLYLALTAVALVAVPWWYEIHSAIHLPATPYELIQNLSLLNLATSGTRLVPPAWSLSVEFFFYIAMAVILARGPRRVAVWLAGSLAITIYLLATGAPFSERYSPAHAASLFFSAGAALYYWTRSRHPLALGIPAIFVLGAVFAAFPLVVEAFGGDPYMLGYYGAALLFIPLFLAAGSITLPRYERIDVYLGGLAYPVFLTHYLAWGVVRYAGNAQIPQMSLAFALAGCAVAIGISVVQLHVFDPPIEQLRKRVRAQSVAASRDRSSTLSSATSSSVKNADQAG